MEDLITHLDNEAGAVVRYGPVLYVVWRAHNMLDTIASADEAVRALTMRHGKDRRLLYVHRAPELSSGHRDSERTRDAVMKHFDRTEPYFRASAMVIEAKGFVGALVRSAASTMTLIRRSGVKSKVFDDVPPALRWLASMAQPGATFDHEAMMAELVERDLCRPPGLERHAP